MIMIIGEGRKVVGVSEDKSMGHFIGAWQDMSAKQDSAKTASSPDWSTLNTSYSKTFNLAMPQH